MGGLDLSGLEKWFSDAGHDVENFFSTVPAEVWNDAVAAVTHWYNGLCMDAAAEVKPLRDLVTACNTFAESIAPVRRNTDAALNGLTDWKGPASDAFFTTWATELTGMPNRAAHPGAGGKNQAILPALYNQALSAASDLKKVADELEKYLIGVKCRAEVVAAGVVIMALLFAALPAIIGVVGPAVAGLLASTGLAPTLVALGNGLIVAAGGAAIPIEIGTLFFSDFVVPALVAGTVMAATTAAEQALDNYVIMAPYYQVTGTTPPGINWDEVELSFLSGVVMDGAGKLIQPLVTPALQSQQVSPIVKQLITTGTAAFVGAAGYLPSALAQTKINPNGTVNFSGINGGQFALNVGTAAVASLIHLHPRQPTTLIELPGSEGSGGITIQVAPEKGVVFDADSLTLKDVNGNVLPEGSFGLQEINPKTGMVVDHFAIVRGEDGSPFLRRQGNFIDRLTPQGAGSISLDGAVIHSFSTESPAAAVDGAQADVQRAPGVTYEKILTHQVSNGEVKPVAQTEVFGEGGKTTYRDYAFGGEGGHEIVATQTTEVIDAKNGRTVNNYVFDGEGNQRLSETHLQPSSKTYINLETRDFQAAKPEDAGFEEFKKGSWLAVDPVDGKATAAFRQMSPKITELYAKGGENLKWIGNIQKEGGEAKYYKNGVPADRESDSVVYAKDKSFTVLHDDLGRFNVDPSGQVELAFSLSSPEQPTLVFVRPDGQVLHAVSDGTFTGPVDPKTGLASPGEQWNVRVIDPKTGYTTGTATLDGQQLKITHDPRFTDPNKPAEFSLNDAVVQERMSQTSGDEELGLEKTVTSLVKDADIRPFLKIENLHDEKGPTVHNFLFDGEGVPRLVETHLRSKEPSFVDLDTGAFRPAGSEEQGFTAFPEGSSFVVHPVKGKVIAAFEATGSTTSGVYVAGDEGGLKWIGDVEQVGDKAQFHPGDSLAASQPHDAESARAGGFTIMYDGKGRFEVGPSGEVEPTFTLPSPERPTLVFTGPDGQTLYAVPDSGTFTAIVDPQTGLAAPGGLWKGHAIDPNTGYTIGSIELHVHPSEGPRLEIEYDPRFTDPNKPTEFSLQDSFLHELTFGQMRDPQIGGGGAQPTDNYEKHTVYLIGDKNIVRPVYQTEHIEGKTVINAFRRQLLGHTKTVLEDTKFVDVTNGELLDVKPQGASGADLLTVTNGSTLVKDSHGRVVAAAVPTEDGGLRIDGPSHSAGAGATDAKVTYLYALGNGRIEPVGEIRNPSGMKPEFRPAEPAGGDGLGEVKFAPGGAAEKPWRISADEPGTFSVVVHEKYRFTVDPLGAVGLSGLDRGAPRLVETQERIPQDLTVDPTTGLPMEKASAEVPPEDPTTLPAGSHVAYSTGGRVTAAITPEGDLYARGAEGRLGRLGSVGLSPEGKPEFQRGELVGTHEATDVRRIGDESSFVIAVDGLQRFSVDHSGGVELAVPAPAPEEGVPDVVGDGPVVEADPPRSAASHQPRLLPQNRAGEPMSGGLRPPGRDPLRTTALGLDPVKMPKSEEVPRIDDLGAGVAEGTQQPIAVPAGNRMAWAEQLDLAFRESGGLSQTRIPISHDGTTDMVTFSITEDHGQLAAVLSARDTPGPIAMPGAKLAVELQEGLSRLAALSGKPVVVSVHSLPSTAMRLDGMEFHPEAGPGRGEDLVAKPEGAPASVEAGSPAHQPVASVPHDVRSQASPPKVVNQGHGSDIGGRLPRAVIERAEELVRDVVEAGGNPRSEVVNGLKALANALEQGWVSYAQEHPAQTVQMNLITYLMDDVKLLAELLGESPPAGEAQFHTENIRLTVQQIQSRLQKITVEDDPAKLPMFTTGPADQGLPPGFRPPEVVNAAHGHAPEGGLRALLSEDLFDRVVALVDRVGAAGSVVPVELADELTVLAAELHQLFRPEGRYPLARMLPVGLLADDLRAMAEPQPGELPGLVKAVRGKLVPEAVRPEPGSFRFDARSGGAPVPGRQAAAEALSRMGVPAELADRLLGGSYAAGQASRVFAAVAKLPDLLTPKEWNIAADQLVRLLTRGFMADADRFGRMVVAIADLPGNIRGQAGLVGGLLSKGKDEDSFEQRLAEVTETAKVARQSPGSIVHAGITPKDDAEVFDEFGLDIWVKAGAELDLAFRDGATLRIGEIKNVAPGLSHKLAVWQLIRLRDWLRADPANRVTYVRISSPNRWADIGNGFRLPPEDKDPKGFRNAVKGLPVVVGKDGLARVLISDLLVDAGVRLVIGDVELSPAQVRALADAIKTRAIDREAPPPPAEAKRDLVPQGDGSYRYEPGRRPPQVVNAAHGNAPEGGLRELLPGELFDQVVALVDRVGAAGDVVPADLAQELIDLAKRLHLVFHPKGGYGQARMLPVGLLAVDLRALAGAKPDEVRDFVAIIRGKLGEDTAHGLPAVVREGVNRALLPTYRERLAAEIRRLETLCDPAVAEWVADLTDKLASMVASGLFTEWGERASAIAVTLPPAGLLEGVPATDVMRTLLSEMNHPARNDPAVRQWIEDVWSFEHDVSGIHAQVTELKWSPRRLEAKFDLVRRYRTIGAAMRTMTLKRPGEISVVHDGLQISDEAHRASGFGSAFLDASENFYIAQGVHHIVLDAVDVGRYVWARRDFEFKKKSSLDDFINVIQKRADEGRLSVDALHDWENLRQYIPRGESRNFSDAPERGGSTPNDVDLTPYELVRLGYRPGKESWDGQEIFLSGKWWPGIKFLVPPESDPRIFRRPTQKLPVESTSGGLVRAKALAAELLLAVERSAETPDDLVGSIEQIVEALRSSGEPGTEFAGAALANLLKRLAPENRERPTDAAWRADRDVLESSLKVISAFRSSAEPKRPDLRAQHGLGDEWKPAAEFEKLLGDPLGESEQPVRAEASPEQSSDQEQVAGIALEQFRLERELETARHRLDELRSDLETKQDELGHEAEAETQRLQQELDAVRRRNERIRAGNAVQAQLIYQQVVQEHDETIAAIERAHQAEMERIDRADTRSVPPERVPPAAVPDTPVELEPFKQAVGKLGVEQAGTPTEVQLEADHLIDGLGEVSEAAEAGFLNENERIERDYQEAVSGANQTFDETMAARGITQEEIAAYEAAQNAMSGTPPATEKGESPEVTPVQESLPESAPQDQTAPSSQATTTQSPQAQTTPRPTSPKSPPPAAPSPQPQAVQPPRGQTDQSPAARPGATRSPKGTPPSASDTTGVARTILLAALARIAPGALELRDGGLRLTEPGGWHVVVSAATVARAVAALARRVADGATFERLTDEAANWLNAEIARIGHPRPAGTVTRDDVGADTTTAGLTTPDESLRPEALAQFSAEVIERIDDLTTPRPSAQASGPSHQPSSGRTPSSITVGASGASVPATGSGDAGLAALRSALEELLPADFGGEVLGWRWSADGTTLLLETRLGGLRRLQPMLGGSTARRENHAGADPRLHRFTVAAKTIAPVAAAGSSPEACAQAVRGLSRIWLREITRTIERIAVAKARPALGAIGGVLDAVRSAATREESAAVLFNTHRYLERTWRAATGAGARSVAAEIEQVAAALRMLGRTPPVAPWDHGGTAPVPVPAAPETSASVLVTRVREITDVLRGDTDALAQRIAAHEASAAEAGDRATRAHEASVEEARKKDGRAAERSRKAAAESSAALQAQRRHQANADAYRTAQRQAAEARISYLALLNVLERISAAPQAASVDVAEARLLGGEAGKLLTSYGTALAAALPPPAMLPAAVPTGRMPYLTALTEVINTLVGPDHALTPDALGRRLYAEFRKLPDGTVLSLNDGKGGELSIRLTAEQWVEVLNPPAAASETMLGTLSQGGQQTAGTAAHSLGVSASFNLLKLLQLVFRNPLVDQAAQIVEVDGQIGYGRQSSETGSVQRVGLSASVLDDRGAHALFTAREVAWEVRYRRPGTNEWSPAEHVTAPMAGDASSLSFWLSRAFTVPAPQDTVQLPAPDRQKVPFPEHGVLAMTGLEETLARTVDVLRAQGVELDQLAHAQLRSVLTEELPGRLYTAINSPYGLLVPVVSRGRTVAVLRIRTTPDLDSVDLVGAPSTQRWQERVRVGLTGTGGAESITTSGTVGGSVGGKFPNLGLPGPLVGGVQFGLNGSGAYGTSSTYGMSVGDSTYSVVVDRFVGHGQTFRTRLTYKVDAQVFGKETQAFEQAGHALLQAPEAELYRYGLPVSAAAIEKDPSGTAITNADGSVRLRDDPSPMPSPWRSAEVPRFIGDGDGQLRGVGPGLVQDVTGVTENAEKVLAELAKLGFVPRLDGDGLPIWSGTGGTNGKSRRLITLRNMLELLDWRWLATHWDAVTQNGMTIDLMRFRAGHSAEHYGLRVRVVQHFDRFESEGTTSTTLRATLDIGSDTSAISRTRTTGPSVGGGGSAGYAAASGGKGPGVAASLTGGGSWSRSDQWSEGDTVNGVILEETSGPMHVFRGAHTVEFTLVDGKGRETPLGSFDGHARYLWAADLLPPANGPRDQSGSTASAAGSVPPPTATGQSGTPGQTAREVLGLAKLVHLDVGDLANTVAKELAIQPGAAAYQQLDALFDPRTLMAHPEWLTGGAYGTDLVIDTGGSAPTVVSVWGRAKVGASTPVASIDTVDGVINLTLDSVGHGSTRSRGGNLAISPGGTFKGPVAGADGGGGLSGSWTRSETDSDLTIFGIEDLEIGLDAKVLSGATVDFEVFVRKNGQEIPLAAIPSRSLLYSLGESDALALYGQGRLALPLHLVTDVMERFLNGTLDLDRTTAVPVVGRYLADLRAATAAGAPVPEPSDAHTPEALAEKLISVTGIGDAPEVPDPAHRLDELLRRAQDAIVSPEEVALPEHLRGAMGSTVIDKVELATSDGESTTLHDAIRDGIQRVLPRGARVDRTLAQSLREAYGGDRPNTRFDDFLQPGGISKQFVVKVGGLSAELITVEITATIGRDARSGGTDQDRGIIKQRYLYEQSGKSVTSARSLGYQAGASGSGGGWGLRYSASTGRAVAHAASIGRQWTWMQRLSLFGGVGLVKQDLGVTIRVTRRPLRGPGARAAGKPAGAPRRRTPRSATVTLTGSVQRAVPAAVLRPRAGRPVAPVSPPDPRPVRLEGMKLFVEATSAREPFTVLREMFAGALGKAAQADIEHQLKRQWSATDRNTAFPHMLGEQGHQITVHSGKRRSTAVVHVSLADPQVVVDGIKDGEIGAVHRSQSIAGWSLSSGRLRPLTHTAEVDHPFGSVAVPFGAQASESVSDSGGNRNETSGFEKGELVTVKFRANYDITVTRGKKQVQRTASGDAYITMFAKDLNALRPPQAAAHTNQAATAPEAVRPAAQAPPPSAAPGVPANPAGVAPARRVAANPVPKRAPGVTPERIPTKVADLIRSEAAEFARMARERLASRLEAIFPVEAKEIEALIGQITRFAQTGPGPISAADVSAHAGVKWRLLKKLDELPVRTGTWTAPMEARTTGPNASKPMPTVSVPSIPRKLRKTALVPVDDNSKPNAGDSAAVPRPWGSGEIESPS